MPNYLNLDYLHTFVVAAKTGKLTTTSEIVYLSHSAVSMQIKKLERRLDTELFIRNKDALTLTKDGQTLLNYANQMLNLNDDAVAKMRSANWSGTIVIGAPTDYSKIITNKLYPLLKEEFPNYNFKFVCSRSRELRKMIENGEVDFSIVAMEPQYPDDILLWEESLTWVCSNDFELPAKSPLPIAIFSDNCIMNDYALYSLKRSNVDFVINFTSKMMDNLVDAVKNKISVSLLPESLVTSDCNKVPEDYLSSNFNLQIGFTWNQDKKANSELKDKVLELTKQAIQQCDLIHQQTNSNN